ncbi:amino acid adenylation domain-containing protein [Streptomyces sp. NPDC050287]|uniref:amino acid adenylation domain-containing protein n=1 Tax=Streptomyces sp. NPDC050287 TaxID=3365608 RepID=UPI0037ABB13C
MLATECVSSSGQEQIWLTDQLVPGSAVNHMVLAWRLQGRLDQAALQGALDLLVERHEAFRTTLHWTERGLVQRVDAARRVELGRLSLEPGAAACEEEGERPQGFLEGCEGDAIARCVSGFVRLPFDLSAGAMLRAALVYVRPDCHVLVITVHHSACDGWSFGILREELRAAYTARVTGARPHLPPIAMTFREFAVQERARHTSADEDRGWLPPASGAGLSRAPDDGRLARGGELVSPAGIHRFTLPASAYRTLIDRAAAVGATPNMALLAAFALVLSRWQGRDEAVLTTPISTRNVPELERTIGFFVDTVPLVVPVRAYRSFEHLLKQVRTSVLTAIESVQAGRTGTHSRQSGGSGGADSIHPVSFAVEHADSERFSMGGLDVTPCFIHPGETRFGLAVRVELDGDRAEVTLEYAAGTVSEEVAIRVAGHFRETVAAVGTGGGLDAFPAVPDQDGVGLEHWARGPRREPLAGVLEGIARQVRERPDAPAIRDSHTVVSYRALWSTADGIRRRLLELGTGPEDLVAVSLPRSAGLLAAVLGVLSTGAAFVPLDVRDPADRRDLLLARCRARVLIAEDGRDGGWSVGEWTGPVMRIGRCVSEAGAAFPAGRPVPPVHPGPEALAYVIHTSGSTGTPKGVMITHRGLANYLWWAMEEYGVGPGATVPLHTSVAFDMAVTSLLGPLLVGACVDVLPEERGPLAVAEHWDSGYRMVKGTPTHLLAVMEKTDVSPVRPAPSVLVLGGEQLPGAYVREWARRAPGTRMVNEYGPTETVVGSVAHTVAGDRPGATVPIGTPIANTQVHVVDDELRPLPVGVRGELVIGGAGVARGYLDAPGLTAEKFVPDPFDPRGGGRLYRTGDIASWTADGMLELHGRADDQLKILGYRVEPGEIEAVMANAPGVRKAAVVADRRNEPDIRLVGFVCPEQPGPADTLLASLGAHLRDRLPAHMVPEILIVRDDLPTDANGKTDRKALPLPDGTGPEEDPSLAGGTTGSHWQAVVRAAWSDVLGRDGIPADVNFFEAGGTSLMLLRLRSVLRARGVTGLTVRDLVRHATIGDLAWKIVADTVPPPGAARGGPTTGPPLPGPGSHP